VEQPSVFQHVLKTRQPLRSLAASAHDLHMIFSGWPQKRMEAAAVTNLSPDAGWAAVIVSGAGPEEWDASAPGSEPFSSSAMIQLANRGTVRHVGAPTRRGCNSPKGRG